MYCFWFDILKSVSSGLATGLILVFIGLRVWKYQLHYTKKFDVYIKSLANISQIKWLFESIRSPLRQMSVKDIYQQNKELFEQLERNKFEFRFYFGKEYEKDFDLFFKTMINLFLDENLLETVPNIPQDKILEYKENLYGNDKQDDKINTQLKESFQRIENALKKKKSEKK
jgi:hypothetical protein